MASKGKDSELTDNCKVVLLIYFARQRLSMVIFLTIQECVSVSTKFLSNSEILLRMLI